MSGEYLDVLRDLWQYHEFRVLFHALHYSLLIAAIGLLVLFLLHAVYVLGFNSPLYYKKSPARGWSKRFIPSVALLVGVLIGLYWLGDQLVSKLS